MNPNVRLVLLYSFLLSVTSSLISQTPLAAYILFVTEDTPGVPGVAHRAAHCTHSTVAASDLACADNLAVGIATGIQGVISLLCALPAGVLADRVGRQRVLRAAACVGFCAAAYMAA